jgi:hypothetical protein
MGVPARAAFRGTGGPGHGGELAARRRWAKIPRLVAMQLAHIDPLNGQIKAVSAEITSHLTAPSAGEPPIVPPGPMYEGARSPRQRWQVPP